MPDLPNIKAEILVWCLSQYDRDTTTFSMIECAEDLGYDQGRVCREVNELYPYLEWGTSPRFPWIAYKQLPKVHERLQDWGYHE